MDEIPAELVALGISTLLQILESERHLEEQTEGILEAWREEMGDNEHEREFGAADMVLQPQADAPCPAPRGEGERDAQSNLAGKASGVSNVGSASGKGPASTTKAGTAPAPGWTPSVRSLQERQPKEGTPERLGAGQC